ncbi:hypothetical protein CHLNCDRAFT_33094 [Chlorella variabilis]|uniref:Ubiquitin carboxyl-terminal hydrolase n=1 Tax=Chlorella variabilis TaxID=554065 RepID=E1ZRV7_CHLVA|nr:hypothetical protein CHLNCDRAFT_33094 [Chlorella variabilis]EFN51528.1 hypothetical protein CHLNCDRAFT_33094 [Chlorella variabilis]|eukprot:XP_005843630.1 hypothetical protein CHLNCDRAFT_33094 [Chlorella variabilis]
MAVATVDDSVLDLVRKHMREVKVPGNYDRVYKDECMFCFASPESPGGLYINLATHQAFDEEHMELDQQRTSAMLYLHRQARRVPLSEAELKKREDEKPNKMAIGVKGGFQLDEKDYRLETEEALVLLPAWLRIPLPCPELPELVLSCITAVQKHDSASHQASLSAWHEERRVSKYAEHLEQLPATRNIPMDPKEWKCDETGLQENLWLNLSTGFIGCGRQQYGMDSGTGSAMKHYEATGRKYPLVVKLGTITPHGADVYSYAPEEDDMVLDPHLARHLAHWGIDMIQMEKTEKSIAELEIDQNVAMEFDKITEAGAHLKPLSGPGFVGLTNLGNSCYMNSVLQLLWALPELHQRYVDKAAHIFKTAPQDPAVDFATQFAKVSVAERLGRGSWRMPALCHKSNTWQPTVRPQAFKSLVGKGHSEFSSGRQQDAQEFFGHLLEVLSRAEHAAGSRLPGAAAEPTTRLFKFGTEDRIQCTETGRVRLILRCRVFCTLHIPMEAAENRNELEQFQERQQKRQKLKEEGSAAADEHVTPRVPFTACLEMWAADNLVDGYSSAAAGRKTQAAKRPRFSSFPPYLLVQMLRYYRTETGEEKKLDVEIPVPEELDLEPLRAQGLQAGEQLQPDAPDEPPAAASHGAAAPAAPPGPQPDDTIVAQLVSMGFSENGSKRAALAVGNSSTDAAATWVFDHIEDPDFNDPLPASGKASTGGVAGGGPGAPEPSAESLSTLGDMGFNERQARIALAACQGSVERAVDWLFSRHDNLDIEVEEAAATSTSAAGGSMAAAPSGDASASAAQLLDGPGQYELVGIVSHMGANTTCGHYVCHVKKEGQWVIFNDEKVAASQHPPFDRGYLYLYRRRQ